jgi:CRP/FNR family cyclic AMP-dependent transcriptional regulator
MYPQDAVCRFRRTMLGRALEDLTRNDWTLIESKAKRISVGLGQEIIKEGARIDHLYVLRQGSASVQLEGTTSQAVLSTPSEGDVFGEMAFLGDSTATASVVAKDEVEIDAIWADDLRELIATFPGFGARFYRSLSVILAQRLRQTSRELVREMTRKR